MSDSLYKRRVIVAVCSLMTAIIFLLFRLFCLSYGENESMEALSGQYTRKNTVAGHYGFIYDTKGKLMSHTESGTLAVINPYEVADKEKTAVFVASHSAHSGKSILERLNGSVPFTVSLDCTKNENTPQGVELYPLYTEENASVCRHLLGYRNGDGKAMSGFYKLSGDTLFSLSLSYTSDAAGGLIPGQTLITEDALYTSEKGIVTTLNFSLQKKIDEICDKHLDMGAVIVSDIQTGEILALCSRPLYKKDSIAAYLDSDRGELINRAFAAYTPGSVFKALVAAAALEKELELYEYEYTCTGSCDVSGKLFFCHKNDGHGSQTMKEAFANSCNTYFIKLMNETGFDAVLSMCEKMGLADLTDIDGFGVQSAFLPEKGRGYPDAYKANFSFGQGDLLLTPLHIMRIYGICASGKKTDFSLVKGMYDGDVFKLSEEKESERILSRPVVRRMRKMMEECVKSGTGKAAFSEDVGIGGKTATSQSGQIKDGKEVVHRIFAGVFPIDNPKFTLVVLCDGNGENKASPQVIFSECASEVVKLCNK